MAKSYYLTNIHEAVSIPTPVELGAAEQSAILAKAKEQFDPAASEAECFELLRQRDLGLLVSAEELVGIIDNLTSSATNKQKESA